LVRRVIGALGMCIAAGGMGSLGSLVAVADELDAGSRMPSAGVAL
jgi:hypothetical protein